MSSVTPVYTANRPLGENLTYSPIVSEYVSQLNDRPHNRPGDRRINNKRLLLIYDGFLSDDQIRNHFRVLRDDIDVATTRDADRTYVVINSERPYVGDRNHFIVNGIEPSIKTIYASQLPKVVKYFNDNNRRDVELPIPELPRPTFNTIPQPDLPVIPSTWYDEINELRNESPSKTVHWYWESRGNTGKTRLANEIEDNNRDWLVVNDLSEVYYLISNKISNGGLNGIILDLDRMYEEDPITYRVITWILDGRMSKKGRIIKFNPIHIVVLSNWTPFLHALSEGVIQVTEIIRSY